MKKERPLLPAAAADDPLHIDQKRIPKNQIWEWKAEYIYGRPNTQHMDRMLDDGWQYVKVKKNGGRSVQRMGMRLMWLPKRQYEKAKERDRAVAAVAVRLRFDDDRDHSAKYFEKAITAIGFRIDRRDEPHICQPYYSGSTKPLRITINSPALRDMLNRIGGDPALAIETAIISAAAIASRVEKNDVRTYVVGEGDVQEIVFPNYVCDAVPGSVRFWELRGDYEKAGHAWAQATKGLDRPYISPDKRK